MTKRRNDKLLTPYVEPTAGITEYLRLLLLKEDMRVA